MSYRGRGGGGGQGDRGGFGGRGGGGGRGGRGGGRGGGNGGSGHSSPFQQSPGAGNGGFGSPSPSAGRGGGRGGSSHNGGYSPQQQQSPFSGAGSPRGGGRGGSGSGFQTPVRSQSAQGFYHKGGSAGARFGQPSFGSGGGGGKYGSPMMHHAPSNLVSLGAFNMDERAHKSSVSLSVKMGGAGLEDAHVTAVVVPFMRDVLGPHVRAHYAAGFRREQIQMNIELQDNYLTSVGVQDLCNYLLTLLTSVDLPYRLVSIKLWNNQIGDEGCEALARVLVLASRVDSPLAELHLSHNQVSERGAAAIFNAVYAYAAQDTTLTKINTQNGSGPFVAAPPAVAATPSASSSSSSSSPSPLDSFVLPPNCLDTGVVVSPPPYPLWLRLEWNLVNFTLFAKYFKWVNADPQALKKEAKRLRKAAKKATEDNSANGSNTPIKRQSSQESTDVDEPKSAVSAREQDDDEEDEDEHGAVRNNREIESEDDNDSHNHERDNDDDNQEANSEEDEAALPIAEDEKEDDADEDSDAPAAALAALTLGSSPATSVAGAAGGEVSGPPAKPLSFALPPEGLRICPASNRTQCTVRLCRYPNFAHIHLCFFHLQHQSYENSDLLNVLQKQRKARKIAKPQPISERDANATSATTASATAAATTVAVEGKDGAASASSSSSVAPEAAAAPASAAAAGARPLVIFLDTNSVFSMISARHEVRNFHWDGLLSLAVAGQFGSCFADPERRVFLVLCSAVLNEMDARKEYSKKQETGAFANQRFNHLSILAKQIKAQFQMSVADQSAGFLARCKNLGGVGQGFLKTVSISQGEMNIHPSLRASVTDVRNTSNDRRILNAALFWMQTLAETGVVLLMTDDRNLANLAQSEGVPSVSLHALDRALESVVPFSSAHPLDSVCLRAAIAGCSADLSESLDNSKARPAPRMDRNVYEALQDALELVSGATADPELKLQKSREEIMDLLECWKGVLANAPQLLTTLRNNRNSHLSATPAPASASASSASASPSPELKPIAAPSALLAPKPVSVAHVAAAAAPVSAAAAMATPKKAAPSPAPAVATPRTPVVTPAAAVPVKVARSASKPAAAAAGGAGGDDLLTRIDASIAGILDGADLATLSFAMVKKQLIKEYGAGVIEGNVAAIKEAVMRQVRGP